VKGGKVQKRGWAVRWGVPWDDAAPFQGGNGGAKGGEVFSLRIHSLMVILLERRVWEVLRPTFGSLRGTCYWVM